MTASPRLLLCNGIGGALELWEPLRAALGPYPTIAFDAPGAGGSSVPAYPPSMAGIAGTVTRFLDRLGVDRVDALGVSWGGALAQQLARSHPDRVRRLVLVATAAGPIVPIVNARILASRLADARQGLCRGSHRPPG